MSGENNDENQVWDKDEAWKEELRAVFSIGILAVLLTIQQFYPNWYLNTTIIPYFNITIPSYNWGGLLNLPMLFFGIYIVFIIVSLMDDILEKGVNTTKFLKFFKDMGLLFYTVGGVSFAFIILSLTFIIFLSSLPYSLLFPAIYLVYRIQKWYVKRSHKLDSKK